MKKQIITSILALSILFSSCEAVKNTNKTQRGVAIGAGAGAVIGGILGNNIGKGGNGALGAILGGVIGGAAGGLIGNKMDKQAREIKAALPGTDVVRAGEGIQLVLNENAVRFETSKATLTPIAQANLDKLVKVFKEYSDTNIHIFGHTDNTGSEELNNRLSRERAESVKAYLSSKGISSQRFQCIGAGFTEPIATNDTPDGRAMNRRVEFAIVANQKMIQDAQNGK